MKTKPAAVLLAVLSALAAPLALAEDVEFNRDIRPILADNCFQCHGPDINQRKADLRLDEEAAAKEHGAVTAGKPADSELIRRVMSHDDEERMPPAGSGKARLSDKQIELLRKWIAAGANWQEHWSLRPPATQPAPEIKSPEAQAKVINDVDRFLLHQLQLRGLDFSEPADRRTLIRRVYFDLIGIPPTPEQVEAFLNDKSENAFEKVVDQLLDSPHFGERMATYWLDLVRYADTNGIHGDNHREHWLYRDYVIRAFNDNLPFDQFTREQLAGDLLESPTRWQKIASGYNRLNMTTREGGAQAKEYQAKYAADRVRNASTVWMGATLGCAECHNHKFDPYTTRDFYQFAAFFADVQETAVGQQQPTRLPTDEQQQEIDRLNAELAELKQQFEQPAGELAQQLEASLANFETRWKSQSDWETRRPEEARAAMGSEVAVQDDGVIVLSKAKEKEQLVLKLCGEFKGVTGIRIECLTDKSLPAGGPGLAGNGNFVLSEIRVAAGEPQALGKATASHSQNQFPAEAATDGKAETGWAILPQVGKDQQIVAPLAKPVDASELEVTLEFNYGSQHLIGRLRVSTTTVPTPAAGDNGVPENIAKLLKIPAEERKPEQQSELLRWYRDKAPELKPLRDQIAAATAKRDQAVNAAPEVLIAMSGAPRETRILPRGNWLDDSGEIVLPQTPDFLPKAAPDEKQADRQSRLDLANWLVDPNHPFTARVMVNRLWKIAFGHGIVRTLDDFGAQGRWPSQPALLDYLAVEFRDHGWDVKRTLRLIVTSYAYRQSSAVSPALRELDPFNDLYARQSRFRLDAELVRDNALAVSGLLVDKVGGPSAKPYQPAGYWSHLNFPRREYQPSTDEDQYRRGLYTYWCRTFLHPSLRSFDATTREECTVERPRSNTPLAALALLNDPTYVEAARVLAEQAVLEAKAPGKRLQYIYRHVLSRQPLPAEADALLPLAEAHQRQYEQDREAAEKLLATGIRPRNAELDTAELAAWTSIARVVLNLHETITRN